MAEKPTRLRSGGFAVDVKELPELWHDRKRHLGLPWSFTSYSLNADKLLVNTGLFNLKEDEVLLYRIRDISVQESFGERLFGVGTVCITSSDVSVPHLDLVHVKHPKKVKEVLSQCVEDNRRKNGIRSTELMSDAPAGPHGEVREGQPLPGDEAQDEAQTGFPDADRDGIDDRTEDRRE